ncbi:MAG: nickel pincer cofactor biosynthesis protein LarB [Chloroflexota bacterium]|nr:nickel pincer cofactor biosynthesis protein LarB [Chloroflexota bacterium]
MDEKRIRELLENVRNGSVDINKGIDELKGLPFENLEFARVDHHRAIRQGFPEVVFGQGKTSEQIAEICSAIVKRSGKVLVTRASAHNYGAVKEKIPSAEYDNAARIIMVRSETETDPKVPGVLVACAGTSDLPVAIEASLTAEMMGCEVERIFDVGVAGIHRLFDKLDNLNRARAIVAVAGMEGALASVIGGLVDVPIIAVPTSVGYGASFGGLAALLAMLNSCAPGVGVVNIDNGFGAGYLAANIVLTAAR